MSSSGSDNSQSEPVSVRRGARARKPTLKAIEALESKKVVSIINSSSESSEEDDFGDEVNSEKPSVLHAADGVSGEKIYSFSTLRKQIGLMQKASQAVGQIPKTPKSVRVKVKREISKKMLEDDPYSDSGSEFCVSSESASESAQSESSEAESSPEKSPPRSRRQNFTTNFSKTDAKRKKNQRKYVIKTDDYFAHHSNKSILTSNHTMDKLETPRLPQDQLQKLLKTAKIPEEHKESLKRINDNNSSHFQKWLYLLQENFNILLYGLGSKRKLLQQFQDECLNNDPVIVVNGFFPTLNVKDVLEGILEVMGPKEGVANVFEACETIAEEFEGRPDVRLYLIVHNIEGEMLRNSKSQTVLAKLAAVENIHLIASIDHINAPLVWDYCKLSKFNFTWWDVTSYLPYADETAFENSLLVQKSGTLALSSLRSVFLSLTTNSKGIFMKIVEYQLENGKNQYYQGKVVLNINFLRLWAQIQAFLSALQCDGFPFKKLYWNCRESFLVSSDMALRAQLTEFVDHKMVRLRRSAEGTEFVVIPIANTLLKQFLNEQSK